MRQQLWRVTESGTPDPTAAVTILPIAGTIGSASSAEGVGLLVAVQQRRLGQQRNSLAAARSATAHLHELQVQAAAGRTAARRQAGQASLAADRARRLLAAARAQADHDAAEAAAEATAARAAAQAADRAATQAADRAAAQAAVQAADRAAAQGAVQAAAQGALQGQRAARAAADRTAAGEAAAAHVAAARIEQVRLDAVQQRLNAADASLVSAVSLVATGTGAPAVPSPDVPGAAAQAAVLRVLDATAPGAMPTGYHPSGQVVTGVGSWYGPGFIGSPTSSGTPYDPEQLTCAMLAVPLGTVVRVTTAAGRAVTVLVTDHGPYEPGRVVDLSMRANRVVNLELGAVRVEVLTAS